MKFFLILFFIFALGAVFIISNGSLSLHSQDNFKKFCKEYKIWLDNIFSNMKEVTGQAISLEWAPKNI